MPYNANISVQIYLTSGQSDLSVMVGDSFEPTLGRYTYKGLDAVLNSWFYLPCDYVIAGHWYGISVQSASTANFNIQVVTTGKYPSAPPSSSVVHSGKIIR